MKQIYITFFLLIFLGFNSFSQYCVTGATNFGDTNIDGVSFAGVTNNSVGDCQGYTDFTPTIINVALGSDHDLVVDSDDCEAGFQFGRAFAVYIDWNSDDDFTDAGETIFTQASGIGVSITVPITIPLTATLGNTRMRISVREGTVPASCGTYAWGEVEDYTLNILAATPVTYASSTVSQITTANAELCGQQHQLIKLEVETSGTLSSIDLTQINVDFSNGTTIADLASYEIYYTGNTNTFSTANSFCSGVVGASLVNGVGSQALVTGSNYFWIVVTADAAATIGNIIDAEIPLIVVDGNNHNPAITDPAGSRTMVICTPSPGGVTSSKPTVWIKANEGIGLTAGNVATLTNYADGSPISVTVPAGITNPIAYNVNGYNFNPKMTFNIGYLELSAITATSAIFSTCHLTDLSRTYTHLATHDQVTFSASPEGAGTHTLHGGIDATLTNAAINLTYSPDYALPNVWRYNSNYVTNTTAHNSYNNIVSAKVNTTNTFVNRLWGGQATAAFFDGRTRDWVGDAEEFIIFDNPITQNEMDRVESYLAIKYGITRGINGTSQDYLSADNTTIWSVGANAGYNNDIAGIGRDDAQALSQLKSHTENGNAGLGFDIVTVANGNFAAPAPMGTNKSYMVWGHDAAALYNTGNADHGLTDNGENILSRIDRVWKSQETGTVGTVVIEVDLSSTFGVGGVAGANDLANVRLLVDEDGTFLTNATSIAPTSFNNTTNIAYFEHNFTAGSGINRGFFFTIGSINLSTSPLPVSGLTSEYKCANEITWTTQSERNSDYFRVNLLNASGEKMTSLNTSASGNTSTQTDYSLYTNSTFDYYTIDCVDLDGKIERFGPFANTCESDMYSVYPNPFNTYLTIKGLTEETPYTITNTMGKIVANGSTNSIIETARLVRGVYLLRFKDEVVKLIKN